jgi:TP901 family phage tail tape measure protein
MASGNFVIGVTAQIKNLDDLDRQVGNLKLSKSIRVPIKVDGEKAIKTVNTFKDNVGNTAKEIQIFNEATGKTTRSLGAVSTSVEKTNKALHPLSTGLQDLIKTGAKVAVFSVLATAINGVKDALASTIDVVKDFDDALTEFKKVSDLSGEALNDYAKQLGELGAEVGRTTTEMVQASTNFKKSGFSDQDSAQLAKMATMFQNIADKEISAEQASKFIIAQMKAFNIEANNSIHILDAINNVANNTASGTNDLQLALSKTASAMATAGNTYEQTLALVESGVAVMPNNASTVGNGLRTIAVNIATLAKSNDELVVANGKVKVSLKDEKGELRSTYDILNDLSQGWDKLSRSERVSLAQSLAGKHKISLVLLALNLFNCSKCLTILQLQRKNEINLSVNV